MVKIAASAQIRQYIPTRPRDGRVHEGVTTAAVALMNETSFVSPVRVFRMLDVPQRTPASHIGQFGEIVFGRRRSNAPFKRPRIPRIIAGLLPAKIGPDQVIDKDERGDGLNDSANARNHVPQIPASSGLVRVDAPRHPQKPWNVHEIESQMEANQEKPE